MSRNEIDILWDVHIMNVTQQQKLKIEKAGRRETETRVGEGKEQSEVHCQKKPC